MNFPSRHPLNQTSSARQLVAEADVIIGLELTGNPFVFYPTYQEIANLPLAERVAEMRKPEVRSRILADKPAGQGNPLLYLAQAWEWIFPLTCEPDYEPDASTSIRKSDAARSRFPASVPPFAIHAARAAVRSALSIFPAAKSRAHFPGHAGASGSFPASQRRRTTIRSA